MFCIVIKINFQMKTIDDILRLLNWQKLKCHSMPSVSENVKHRECHTAEET